LNNRSILRRDRRPQSALSARPEFLISTACHMSAIDPQSHSTPAARARAFSVHIFTALGGAVALAAMLQAVHENWAAMFGWLGLALLIDGVDGPLARRFDVNGTLPNWSGDTLDLVVDFLTYVFVPAYAITASRLLVPLATPWIGMAIVMSGALYFADRRMKTDDNHFRGFPALWNGAAFYLFVLKPEPWVASILMALLVVFTFVPINTVHPLRTMRWRPLNIAMIAVWAVLAVYAIFAELNPGLIVAAMLCAIAAYLMLSDSLVKYFGGNAA
jgi:phosphatidylcholine synthase